METSSRKTYPKRSNRIPVNYNSDSDSDFNYDSWTEGISSDNKEEIHNISLNEYLIIDDINNGSDDLQNYMNVMLKDEIDFSFKPAQKKKKQLI